MQALALDLLGLRLCPGVDLTDVRLEAGLEPLGFRGRARRDQLDLFGSSAFELRIHALVLRRRGGVHGSRQLAEEVVVGWLAGFGGGADWFDDRVRRCEFGVGHVVREIGWL
jgi:hypothetical protein